MMRVFITFLFIFAILLNAKDIVVVTDISVEPSKKGLNAIQGQLERLLYFDIEQQAPYLKFGDKVTMAYMNNRAEEASVYNGNINIPTFDLSQENLDEFGEEYLDNYLDTAIGYMNDVISVEKQKIEVSKGREIVICIDDSRSMQKLTGQLSSVINTLITTQVKEKDQVGFASFSSDGKARISSLTADKGIYSEFSDFRETNKLQKSADGPYLADGLNKSLALFTNSDNEKILFLVTDGVDKRSDELKSIKKIKDRGIKIIPIAIGADINMEFLSEISVNGQVQNANSLNLKDTSYLPNIPILESLHQIINNNYFSSDSKEKKLFILSTLLQNSENLSVFHKIFDADAHHQVSVIGLREHMKFQGYDSSLDGVEVQILMLPSDTKANKSKRIKDIFEKYLLALGAKEVKILQGSFDLK